MFILSYDNVVRVIRRVYNTFAFQSCDIEVPAVGTGSTSIQILQQLLFLQEIYQIVKAIEFYGILFLFLAGNPTATFIFVCTAYYVSDKSSFAMLRSTIKLNFTPLSVFPLSLYHNEDCSDCLELSN